MRLRPAGRGGAGSGAIEIVDIYHAKQHLSDAAKALYGPGADRADAWARQRHDELDDGRLRAIVAELGFHSKTSDAARRRLDYIVRNRRRMRCPRFRARGLCVSSGVVEAGCKRVVGARLKRAGLRWTVAGANAIIAPRCCPAQRPLRGLLGATSRPRRLTGLTKSDVHPRSPFPIDNRGRVCHDATVSVFRGRLPVARSGARAASLEPSGSDARLA